MRLGIGIGIGAQPPAGGAGAPAFPAATSEWLMDEGSGQTAADNIGANDLQLGLTAGVDTEDPAWVAAGLDFTGLTNPTTDLLDGGALFNFNWLTDPVSFSFAARADGLATIPTLFSKANRNSPFTGYTFRLRSSGGTRIEFTAFGTSNQISIHWTGSPVLLTQWHSYVLTYDGSGDAAGVKLYIDGLLETPSVQVDTLTIAAQSAIDFRVGATELSLGWDGAIGVGRVWDGTELTAGQASAVRDADVIIMAGRSVTME